MMNTHHFETSGLLSDCPVKNRRHGTEGKPEPLTLMEKATVKTTVLVPLTPAASRSARVHEQNGILASRADAEEVIVC